MSYALPPPSAGWRGSLLGVVVGLHVAALLVVLAARTVAPKIIEMPLIVDLLPSVAPEPPKVQAVAKPVPVRQPSPKVAAPALEATRSELPAPSAPAATPAPTPVPPAPAPAPAVEPVTQARFDANYLKNPAPPYPPLSRRMGEEGKVVLRVSVTSQGTADSVEVKTSSGSQRLDDAAQKTVRNWKFVPAQRGDAAVQSWVLVPIIFKLEQ